MKKKNILVALLFIKSAALFCHKVDYEKVITIAHEAGTEILKIYNNASEMEIQIKDDNSPLTKADMAAHNHIAQELLKLTPSIPLVSEEGKRGNPLASEYVWLVDPLDGTKEFIKKNGMFTVNIALMKKNGARWNPVFGVVYAPVLKKTWIGGKDFPAEIRNTTGKHPMKVTQKIPFPIRLVASLSHRGKQDEIFAAAIGPHTLIRMGSSLKACIVAEGGAELYPRFGPTSCWDIGAAHAVVEAAGGIIVDPKGRTLDYDVVDKILNPYFLVACNTQWNKTWIHHQN